MTVTKNDLRDWFVMILIANALAAATVYIFMHSSDTVFATWCGLVSTVGGIYHWLNVRDSKTPDAS